MTKAHRTALSASIHQRLLNWSVRHRADPNLVFTRYVLERLLYRVSRSPYRGEFILKGAMLFTLWTGEPHRPTRDLDLLGFGDPAAQRLRAAFEAVCTTPVEPDALEFDSATLRIAPTREQQEYLGQSLKVVAHLGSARFTARVDVGFGDAVTPRAKEIDYPTLLDLPAPRIRAYPRETVVAEKLQAVVALGMVNSRMKDFFDLFVLCDRFAFDGAVLRRAVTATFARRRTDVPPGTPTGLSEAFAADRDRQTQWLAFLRRSQLEGAAPGLPVVVERLRAFLVPVLQAAAGEEPFTRAWTPGGPWS